MFRNYLIVAFRNIRKKQAPAILNIAGLAAGMAVALLIGLWIWNELSFNHYHTNYRDIAQVWDTEVWNGEAETSRGVDIPLEAELSTRYAGEFRRMSLSTPIQDGHILAAGDNPVINSGMWVEPTFPAMFSFRMLRGSQDALKDPSNILLTASLAETLFGGQDPMNKVIRLDNKTEVKVGGVIGDLPYNSAFHDSKFFLSWDRYVGTLGQAVKTQWGNHAYWLFVEMNDHTDAERVTAMIKDIPKTHLKDGKESILLLPMDKWHLYDAFKDGKNAGGKIVTVWLFGIIGVFVLLLACINFINLSTANSDKRAKEVGIRKAIGSLRSQLIGQFISKSMLIAAIALGFAVVSVLLVLPAFNRIARDEISFPWASGFFWTCTIGFMAITGFISGCYPAFYLSRFEPSKVLKGTFRLGKTGSLARQVLVVTQFTISVTLIIGTIVVFRQIKYARSRPVGYERDGLISVKINSAALAGHYQALRTDLFATGDVENMAESSSPQTSIHTALSGFDWKGKDPGKNPLFGAIGVTHDFGKTIGWHVIQGRDFSRDFSDTGAFILNASAAKLIGLKYPVGQTIRFNGADHKVVGVVDDLLMESPYEAFDPVIFTLDYHWTSYITIRLKPGLPLSDVLDRLGPVFKRYNPGSPFDYHFVDDEFDKKFADEQRIGSLASGFSIFAIFISCLGMFGLALFMAERRTKEIGIRKILGAPVFLLWTMLSKEFLILVAISCLLAIPIAWYSLHVWLQQFQYRTAISWWIFLIAMLGALLMTLLTVSYQSIKAARANPVRSLRTE